MELFCLALGGGVVVVIAIWPLIFAADEFELPLKVWIPFEMKAGAIYWFIIIYQFILLAVVLLYHCTIDFTMWNLMYYNCLQLDVLLCRLEDVCLRVSVAKESNMSTNLIRLMEKQMMSQCIQHHIEIFKYAEKLNEIMFLTIMMQFLTSCIVLCVTGYLMIKSSLLEAMHFITFTLAMLVESFTYNFLGNEVTTKSLDFHLHVSEINWTALRAQSIENIIIMMIRSSLPIVFSCGSLIELSLTTFMKILKMTYSAVNLLIST